MSGTTNVNNPYNVGSDTAIVIIISGVVIGATILTSFDYKQKTTQLDSKGIDGVNRYREVEEGWDGTLEYDKADNVMDAFFAAKEAARYSGGPAPIATITQTDNNADGSTGRYRFDGVALKLEEGGARTGDAIVKQKVAWVASRRIAL
jgi:hypothetical protein